jgi:uncharacterized membrane protein YraQ (UPF0718 family)
VDERCETKSTGESGLVAVHPEGTGITVPRSVADSRVASRYFGAGLLALGIWWLVYRSLPAFSRWVTFSLLGLAPGNHLSSAVEFFVFDGPKVLLLLTLVVFAVGIVRSFFTPARARRILSGKRESAGNVLASLLGVATPFCSCSAVPLFIGFVTSGVPLGVTFSFLVSAPMVNEIALALLYGMERYVEDWVYASPAEADDGDEGPDLSWRHRVDYGLDAVRDIVGKVWLWVLAGIAVGAIIHGYVPENFMAAIMGADAWWSVPLAVLVGIPMYSNAAGIIPIVQALLGKGAALGTVLAFMMSVIGLSLPEMIILRKVLRVRLIATFAGVVGTGILIVGYVFNALM